MGVLPPLALVLASAVIGYLIGSFSSGYAVGKLYRNIDLRSIGSGSTGSTNVLRALGPGAAALVAILDVGKGAVAVFVAQQLLPASDWRPVAEAAAGTAAVAGHCWPITLEGRGGRGISPGFGALLFIASPTAVVALLFFGIAIVLTRIVSVASLSSVAGALIGYLLVSWAGLAPFHWAPLAFIVVGGIIVYVRHIENIRRILTGREPRLGDPLRTS
jgi:glycerol-3-phosphate acyltransferase PlsY